MKNTKKYTVNRFNRLDCEDIEHRYFSNKAEALKWAKRCLFYHIRLTNDRSTVTKSF